jgi:hypothetical protein
MSAQFEIEALTTAVMNQDQQLKKVSRLLVSIKKEYSHEPAMTKRISKAINELKSGAYLKKVLTKV